MDVSKHYDFIYKNEDPFGTYADRIVKKILEYKTKGLVLDLGAGQGRNSVFLAKQGFDVSAIDISSIGIEKLTEKANSFGLKIDAKVGDIRDLKGTGAYDVILAIFVLHHLELEQAEKLISVVKEKTEPNGLNVICAFTKEGDFYKNPKSKNDFYPNQGELKKVYSDWEVLFWEEKETRAYQKRPDGNPMVNTASFLIVQKINSS